MIELSLRDGVCLSPGDAGSVIAECRGMRMRLRGLGDGVADALLRLAHEPLCWNALAGQPSPDAAVPDPRDMQLAFTRLAERHLTKFTCLAGGRELLVAIPVSSAASFSIDALPEDGKVRLSRFASVRRLGEDLVIESLRRLVRVYVRAADAAALVAELAQPLSVSQISRTAASLGREAAEECVRFLLGAGVIGVADEDGRLDEDKLPDLAPREFHDVALHSRSRWGLTDQPTGAQFPFGESIPAGPALKAPMSPDPMPLPVPDLDRIIRDDDPLAQVMERRRSVRRYGAAPITKEQLSEFLYRVGRVRSVNGVDTPGPRKYETSDRTYPSGGAIYDLEIYLTVRCCLGVASGIYHYEPADHALSLVCDQAASVNGLLANAHAASGREDVPQVLVILASRFSRLGWKYRGICYATTLKNVGVLYEAMYLAATAMRLAPCALGGGDSALFSKATGLDPLVESSVGEFMLGSLPPGGGR